MYTTRPSWALRAFLWSSVKAQASYNFSTGAAVLGYNSNAILQFVDSTDPSRQYLLNQTVASFQTPGHSWGAGTIVTDAGTGTWNLDTIPSGTPLTGPFRFNPLDRLSLTVTRSVGPVLTETDTFENTSPDTVEVMQLGIQTPLNDIYNGALGAWAWALAQPMNGEGSSLGLIVRKGQLWSYSLESASSSNIRGNIVLQVTDATRNPDAFGGQPTISIKPGDSYILEWDLAFYNSSTDFIAATQPPATFSAFAVPLAESIVVETPIKPTSPSAGLRISQAGHNQYLLSASSHGAYQVDIGHARTEVSFHLPLETIVQLRTQYILAHQRPTQRPPPLNYAFVSVDTQNYTTVVSSTWPDWGDGSERIAMPTLLQLAAMRGWVKKETVEVALQEGFFNDRYSWLGNSADLDTAVTLLNRAFQLGYVTDAPIIFLSFAVVALSENLDKVGRHNESSAFQNQVIAASANFVNDGENIPASEVSYEQSIVEPLVEMTADTYRWTKNQTFLDATKNQLSWLLAFQGPQPHTRLFQIANRHWDDYWFGLRHQWGDVFPHYWSALTSEALIRLPFAPNLLMPWR